MPLQKIAEVGAIPNGRPEASGKSQSVGQREHRDSEGTSEVPQESKFPWFA